MVRKADFKLIIPSSGADPWLFNLADDPDELKNLSRKPAYAEKLSELTDLWSSVW